MWGHQRDSFAAFLWDHLWCILACRLQQDATCTLLAGCRPIQSGTKTTGPEEACRTKETKEENTETEVENGSYTIMPTAKKKRLELYEGGRRRAYTVVALLRFYSGRFKGKVVVFLLLLAFCHYASFGATDTAL